ncbi:MAG: oligosaccharide flippase family protein [Sandaracinaceae bacterium]|nr:oligosaccharide flippase family protein [Sandaracinaceae bacterium]
MAEASNDETRKAGRGLLWVTSGKIFFIVTAYTVALALPRVFGSEEVYGLFSVAFGAAAMLNAVLISSTLQTVSKLVSEDEAHAPQVLRKALLLQLGIGASLGVVLVGAAPWLAAHVFRSAAYTPLIRVAAAVVLAYALYSALIGYLNGHQRFARQAQLDMTFSVLRTIGLVGGAAVGIGAIGAMSGFSLAAVAILFVALAIVGVGRSGGEGVSWKRLVAFLAPIWLYQAALQGILQIDLQVLHYVASGVAERSGVEDPGAVADGLSGIYRAAQTFAFVPYQLILSVTFVVFPFVSRATSLGDDEATRRYISNALRFSLLVLLAVASPISGAAAGVIRIAYPQGYLVGAGALEILVFGQVAFALFVIGATIVAGGGRPRIAATVAVIGLVVVMVATWSLITVFGVEGPSALVATAIGTSIGTSTALLIIGVMVYRAFGTFVPPLSGVRALVAGAAGFGVARVIPHESALSALGALIGGFVAYGVVLVVTRELGGTELGALRRVLRRGG